MRVISKLLIVLLLIPILSPASASVVFDGNFKSGDTLGTGGSFGAWPSSCLNPQTSTQKTLQVISAPGRPGEYAGLWTLYPGYGCGSSIGDNHAQVYMSSGINTGEYWYGFSIRLDGSTPWPSNAWQKLGIGIISSDFYTASCGSNTGELGMIFEGTTDTSFQLNTDPLCGTTSGRRYYPLLSSYSTDVWHDWMIHVKWAKDTTGFIEVYHRIEGQPYAKLVNAVGIQTKKPTSGNLDVRFGSYRGVAATKIQKYYSMRFKIGTTRADVESGGSNPAPAIISWGNTKTNSGSTSFDLNISQSVTFNVVANQKITTWTWKENGVNAGTNSASYTTSFATGGNKTVSVYGTNSNGTTSIKTWNISVPLITGNFVISNIAAASNKAYIQDTPGVGSLLYIDRTYKFTSIPSSYIGLKYIKTATDDRYRTESNFLQFDVNKSVTIFVAYDDRISPRASWLSSFTDTGENVMRDDSTTFSIYARNYSAGHISLGGTSIPSGGAGGSYVVIAKPVASLPPSSLGVSISESPDPVLSEGNSRVTFHVTSGSSPVTGASVSASATCGSLSSPIALTNSNGDSNATFTAHSVTTPTICTISATVSKTGYIDSSGNDRITITPVLSPSFLNSINVTPTPVSLDVGNTLTFTAAPKDQYNAPYPVTVAWSSTNTTVGTVDPVTGNFTAISPGTTMVNAANGTVTGRTFVTVNPVSNVFVLSNIAAASGKTYIQDTLAVGKLFYIDRAYKFTGVTSSYLGLKYIRTATDDRQRTESNFLRFDVNKGVTVYIAYDDRISPRASWLSSFADTGENIMRDSLYAFSIYARDYPAGNISLGGTSYPGNFAGSYVVIVKPLASPPPSSFLNSINVIPTPVSLDVGSNLTFTAGPKDQYNAPYPATVAWSSSNETVGTVNPVTGKFTALSPGTAMVNATNGTVNGTAFVTVNPVSNVLIISSISAATGKAYVLDKLANSKLFYIDRKYLFTNVPSSYVGLDYIRTAIDDRFRTDTAFLQFDVSQPATVYVAFDDRISSKPSWLTSSFTDTGSDVMRDGTYRYSIYFRTYSAGHVSLDGNSIISGGSGGMYVVIVKSLSAPLSSALSVPISESSDTVSSGSSNVNETTVGVSE